MDLYLRDRDRHLESACVYVLVGQVSERPCACVFAFTWRKRARVRSLLTDIIGIADASSVSGRINSEIASAFYTSWILIDI